MTPRNKIRMRLALRLRGILSRCSASTGADRINANSSAMAMGTNAAWAKYNSTPRPPSTMHPAADGRFMRASGGRVARAKTGVSNGVTAM